jgi:hypothetical protein
MLYTSAVLLTVIAIATPLMAPLAVIQWIHVAQWQSRQAVLRQKAFDRLSAEQRRRRDERIAALRRL